MMVYQAVHYRGPFVAEVYMVIKQCGINGVAIPGEE